MTIFVNSHRDDVRCVDCGNAHAPLNEAGRCLPCHLRREDAAERSHMTTILTLTIVCTDGDLNPDTIAAVERAFGTTLIVEGPRATGVIPLLDGVTTDDLVAHLRALPGVEITRDEVIES